MGDTARGHARAPRKRRRESWPPRGYAARSLARTFSRHSKWRACSQNKFQYSSYSRIASRKSRNLGYLNSFMRGGYMLIAYHLSSDKSRQTILHSCAHSNRLPSTASIIKMCPHLQVDKNKTLEFTLSPKFTILRDFSKPYRANLLPVGRGRISSVCRELDGRMKGHGFDSWDRTNSQGLKGDVTRDDSQRRFLVQQSVAMLEQCSNYSKQCRNNVATLCRAKSRRCKSSRVTSP